MKKGWKVAFIVLAWVVVGVVALEVTARLREKRSLWEGDVWHWPAPYTMFTHRPGGVATQENRMSPGGGSITFRFNSEGFREEEIPLAQARGEIRVMLLGSSVVVNGTTPADTIAKRLERKLRERGFPGAAVWNCGITSCVSGQELALLTHRVPRYRPDLILVFDGVNDIYSPTIYDPRPGYPYNFRRFEEGFARASGKSWTPGEKLSLLLRESALVRALLPAAQREAAFKDQALEKEVAFTSPGWGRQIIASYRENLEKMAAFCRGMGYRGVFTLQPSVFTRKQLFPPERRDEGSPEFQRYMSGQYQAAGEVMRSLQAGVGGEDRGRLAFAELTGVFDSHPGPLYWDFIHFTDQGNELVAGALADLLVREIDLFASPAASSAGR